VATPDKKWEGFDPIEYVIDWSLFSQTPLTEIGEANRQTTAGAVLREALPHLYTSAGDTLPRQICDVEDRPQRLTLKMPSRAITIDKDSGGAFAAVLVATVVRIGQQTDQQSFRPTFFYYGRDHVIDDVHESFSFFVVNDGRIVLDLVTFGRYSGNGFNPEVFKPAFDIEHRVWLSERDWNEARLRWWYRRFYEETDAGQLMQLREDATCYHYVPEWKHRQRMTVGIEQIARNTAQLQLLIYVLIALGLIAILRSR
jgi:hypothetical protein